MNRTSPHPAAQARTMLAPHRRTREVRGDADRQRDPANQELLDGPRSEEHLVAMLQCIGEHDGAAEQLDSANLGRCLGWTAARTATSLEAAKARLLIWGIRAGGSPAPCFEEIELTVQGHRFLRSSTGVGNPT